MGSKWKRIAGFFESGDLVPFAVLVSAYHFVNALMVFGEWQPIAVAQGLLIDMLHFRTVRRAVQSKGAAAKWIALLTTAMSLAFHYLFFTAGIDAAGEVVIDWNWLALLLAAPLPLSIPILAWQQATTQQETADTLQSDYNELQDVHNAIREEYKALQDGSTRLQKQYKSMQSDYKSLQTQHTAAQDASKRQQAQIDQLQKQWAAVQNDLKAWQKLNPEYKALARFNVGQIDAEQTAAIIGVKDTRTVKSRAHTLNGTV